MKTTLLVGGRWIISHKVLSSVFLPFLYYFSFPNLEINTNSRYLVLVLHVTKILHFQKRVNHDVIPCDFMLGLSFLIFLIVCFE